MNPADVILNGSLLAAMPIALLAGLVTFLSPCVLPLVPGYLGYVSGAAQSKTKLVLGAVLLVAPGPGVLVLLAGLGILATEFAWAGRIMMHTKQMASKAAQRTGMKPWVKYFLVAGGAVFSIIAIIIYYNR